MKYIYFFLIFSSIVIITTKTLGVKDNKSVETREPLLRDSVSWFEADLDLYIQEDYFTFDPVNYTQALTPEAKAELSQEVWLGNFTISDMVKQKNCLKVDFSTKEFTKILFITPTYFVLTEYTTSENGMNSGSSLLYDPKTNTLKELYSIIVFDVDKNTLECSREQLTQDGYLIEYGTYDVTKKKLIVNFVE